MTRQRDPGYYDLLASEARLCSFLGIARGQMPLEHWFHLGRQLAPGGRAAVLISWSGSMFEYLMPLLLMPDYDATLLKQSCREAVARQVRYGLRRGVPWGISESCYSQLDSQKTYQYRAFGVPGLGLKQGLHDDLVVAPYATVLALMIDPSAACANLEAMAAQGFLGRYGFYEAADYTPGRVGPGQEFSLVRSHMAHHSGMSLLALDQALLGRPMHRAIPERPTDACLTAAPAGADPPRGGAHADRHDPRGAVPQTRERRRLIASVRTFTTAATAVPEVHLLSNGRYHVMITAAGSGASRWTREPAAGPGPDAVAGRRHARPLGHLPVPARSRFRSALVRDAPADRLPIRSLRSPILPGRRRVSLHAGRHSSEHARGRVFRR